MSKDTLPVPTCVFRATAWPPSEQTVNAELNAARDQRGDQSLQARTVGRAGAWQVG
jgi:hypothetical protein